MQAAVLTAPLVGSLSAGVSYASIPDGTGVIHGCYNKKTGALRVIDTAIKTNCPSDTTSLNWNQTDHRDGDVWVDKPKVCLLYGGRMAQGWEYKLVEWVSGMGADTLERSLNVVGSSGWELASAMGDVEHTDGPHLFLIFKRPVDLTS